MTCVFSIDVEDWFHILDLPTTPPMSSWDSLESHVEKDFQTLLEMMAGTGIRSTCFFLGWVADRFPHLVTAADNAGHEIASHGYCHRLVYELGRKEFSDDVRRSKELIEEIVGKEVRGFRAPGFSVTSETPWYYDELAAAGYRYSSSVFPAARGHGGIRDANLDPYVDPATKIVEFPITVIDKFGKRLCLFGGGYLRLFPIRFIRKAAKEVLQSRRMVNFYIHPREINPAHPRLEMSRMRRFKTYVNLATTQPKLKTLFTNFEFTTFAEYWEQTRDSIQPAQP